MVKKENNYTVKLSIRNTSLWCILKGRKARKEEGKGSL